MIEVLAPDIYIELTGFTVGQPDEKIMLIDLSPYE
jgi:hypothetical protein